MNDTNGALRPVVHSDATRDDLCNIPANLSSGMTVAVSGSRERDALGRTPESEANALARLTLANAIDEIDAPDLSGMHVGPYELGRLLGRGGAGLVYEAIDTCSTSPRFGRRVALKILATDVVSSGQLVREAQFGAAVEHEHIMPV